MSSRGRFVSVCVFTAALRPGVDISNQWMGVSVVSQRSPLGHALVSQQRLNVANLLRLRRRHIPVAVVLVIRAGDSLLAQRGR